MTTDKNDDKRDAEASLIGGKKPVSIDAKSAHAAGATSMNAVAGSKPPKAPQALDRWFDDQLNQLFSDVSNEPLPPDLAKLIGQLKTQSQK